MANKTVSHVYWHVGLVTLILLVAVVAPASVYRRTRVASQATVLAARESAAKSFTKVGPAKTSLSRFNLPLAFANTRVVRVVNGSVLPGQNVVVSIQLDSQGDENALGFSINFDPTKLTYVLGSATNGADAAAATLLVNDSQAALGRVGIGESLNPNVSFPAGTRELVKLTFTAANSVGSTSVGFGDQPIAREVVSKTVTDLTPTTDFTAGSITINNDAPGLTSISPTSALAGSGAFTLTVNGTKYSSGTVVRWNGNSRVTTFVNSTQVTAAITAADVASAGTAPVTVFNPAPGGGEAGPITFNINNPVPAITTLSPTSKNVGEAAFTLTVNGSNFVSTSTVNINGAARTTSFVSSNQLTASIPSSDLSAAGSISVTVVNPSPGGGTSNAVGLSVNNPVPTITTLSPTSKEVNSGAFTLTVNGTNFVTTSAVKFNNVSRVTTFVNATQLTAAILASDITSAGTYPVTVTNPTPGGGTSTQASFTVGNSAPVINNLSPASVAVGGAGFTLTVNGSGYVNGSVVRVNGADRTTSFQSAAQLTAQLLTSDIQTTGTVSITVFNPAPGGGTSLASSLSVENPVPTLVNLSPTSKVAGDAGFTLTVNGTNFNTSSVVRWNGSGRVTTFVNNTQLTAAITAADVASAGNVSVTVFNPAPGGGPSGSTSFTVNNPIPAITTLSPTSKTVGEAAFTLTVNGSNFVNSSTVNVNGAARTTSFVNANQVTASIPAADISAAGSISITVVNPAPGGGPSNGVALSINNPVPTISTLSPTSRTASSGAFTLTVDGTNFVGTSVVKFNNVARVTSFVSPTQLTAAILASDITTAGTYPVTVTNPAPGGGTSTSASFTVGNPVPSINNLEPSTKLVGGAGFTLTVNGASFVEGAVVRVNGADRTTSFQGVTQLTAQLLASDIQATGTLTITVFNPAPGGGLSSGSPLSVENPVPTLTNITPSNKVAGDAAFTLTVNGSNFVAGSVVRWNGTDRVTTFISQNQLTAAITAADVVNAGTPAVTVFNPAPGGGISGSVTLTVVGPNPVPTLASLSPSQVVEGSAAFELTLNGGNFISASVVQWNGSARATTFVNSNMLKAQITAADVATAGNSPLTVVNPAPGGGTSNAVNFTIASTNPSPTLSTLTPNSVLAGASAFTLTVGGSSFIPDSKVRWNGADRVTTFVNANQLTAQITAADIVAAGTTPVTVFNPAPGGGTSSVVNFTVNNPLPTITTLSPTSKTVGSGAFTLTVDGTNFLNTSVVKFNNVARVTTFVSPTQLTAAILASDVTSSGTYPVTVTNATPGGGTSTSASFTVGNPVPSISNLAPSSKLVGGAAFTLTVNGASFVDGAVVRVNGANRTTSFVGATQLTAQLVASDIQATGTLTITVFNPTPGGGVSSSSSLSVENPVPALTNITPSNKVAGDAAFTLTVNGSNFVAGSVVRWNGADRITTFVSQNQLTAAITAADVANAGTPAVTVFNPAPGGGTSSSTTLTVVGPNPVPSITTLSPAQVVGGSGAFELTLNGTNFVSASEVKWNGSPRTTTFVNSNTLKAQITAADVATSGSVPVTVVNPSPGGGTSPAVNFTITSTNPVPVLSSLTPGNASAGGSAFTLTVGGSSFTVDSKVRWNGADRATTFVNATQLTAQINAADITTSGTASVTVFNPAPGGGTSNVQSFSINNPVPGLTSLSSTSAVVGDIGFTLTVNGFNFVSGASVRWNGSARPTTFVDATRVTATISTADLSTVGHFPVTVLNPTPGGGTSASIMFNVDAATSTKTAQFSVASMNSSESAGDIHVTVTRSGDLSTEATVDYHTVDGTATERNDYTTALGTLRFGPGESEKTITVLINDDSKSEGPESASVVLSNPTGGLALGSPSVLTFELTDDAVETGPNINDDSSAFVRQHYHDFLNREADQAGLTFWTNEIESCGADAQCREVKRINVSAAFFLSTEFQETGYYVYRFYKAALPPNPTRPEGLPRYSELLSDSQEVSKDVIVLQTGWQQKLQQNKDNFSNSFVLRPDFISLYPNSMTPAQYVDALNARAGEPLSQTERDGLVAGLTGGGETRASVLRKIVEDDDFKALEFNRAFVLMQYIGYLRRSPDDIPDTNLTGYNFWLNKLNDFHGNFVQAEMVKAFIVSAEYRSRFGP
ncbi:MAG TPA: IPT/TIG domain-containing protein [Pyrinomonadaceae bacterium]|nr:IPT/TIG domain-containing protein [Pyrinomonadaceae bacterium]